jgi:hypothetical protein
MPNSQFSDYQVEERGSPTYVPGDCEQQQLVQDAHMNAEIDEVKDHRPRQQTVPTKRSWQAAIVNSGEGCPGCHAQIKQGGWHMHKRKCQEYIQMQIVAPSPVASTTSDAVFNMPATANVPVDRPTTYVVQVTMFENGRALHDLVGKTLTLPQRSLTAVQHAVEHDAAFAGYDCSLLLYMWVSHASIALGGTQNLYGTQQTLLSGPFCSPAFLPSRSVRLLFSPALPAIQ